MRATKGAGLNEVDMNLKHEELFTIDAKVREDMMVLAFQEQAIRSQASKDLEVVRSDMYKLASQIPEWAALWAWVIRISKPEERNANLQHARKVWLEYHPC